MELLLILGFSVYLLDQRPQDILQNPAMAVVNQLVRCINPTAYGEKSGLGNTGQPALWCYYMN